MDDLVLGQHTAYDVQYDATILQPVARATQRKKLAINQQLLPFYGYDYWTHYEVSWLNKHGKPIVAIATLSYDCSSSMLIESKSLKLYFNSFNFQKFANTNSVIKQVQHDLEHKLQTPVAVNIYPLDAITTEQFNISQFSGCCLDQLNVLCNEYTVNPELLTTTSELVSEQLYSNILKSNCLITQQPDWGSVQISYRGNKICHANLLKYLVSYRKHDEFHEQCIERIFIDISRKCQPKMLTIHGRYTRRGGIDINVYRSSSANLANLAEMQLVRLVRQ